MAVINDMIKNVKENLGNRSSGVIGGTPVDTVVLGGINKGFKNIIKMANPVYYDRIATLSLIIGQVDYPEPTSDEDGQPIKIKQLMSHRLNLVGETEIYLTRQITIGQYLQNSVPSTAEPGIPSTFCYHNRTFKFTRYPDNAYTLAIAVNTTPIDFTTADLNTTLSVDDIWIEVIEAYATHYCYAKLQLTENSAFWYAIYDEAKRENKAVIYKQPGMKKPTYDYLATGDPLTDPFVRSFN